jgi:hypothetical protein
LTSRGPIHHRPPPLADIDRSGRRTVTMSNGSSRAAPSLQSATFAGSVSMTPSTMVRS